jgi:hypothetical protein
VPGERPSPTQPYVAKPPAVIDDVWPGVYPLADIVSFGYCSRIAQGLIYHDLKTGEVLLAALVSAPAVSMPAVYEYKGKQYVTFAAGGNSILTPRVSDEIVTFALP